MTNPGGRTRWRILRLDYLFGNITQVFCNNTAYGVCHKSFNNFHYRAFNLKILELKVIFTCLIKVTLRPNFSHFNDAILNQ